MHHAVSILVVLLLSLGAIPAEGQNGHRPPPRTDREVVLHQLDAAVRAKQREGFTTVRPFDARSLVGLLPQHGVVVVEVQLRAGAEYFVSGTCDTDCDDLDLRALTPDGLEVLAEDVETDAVPVLQFTARETGPHLLGVVMSACRTEYCYFGVRVLSR
jgi:hypothetical protein